MHESYLFDTIQPKEIIVQELTFTYEPEDYYYAKEIIYIDRIAIHIIKVLTVPFCISCYISIMYGGLYLYLSILLMFIVAFIVSKLFIKHILKSLQGIHQEITLKFDEETIFCYTGVDKSIQTTYTWNAIKSVYNTKNLLIIFVSDWHCLIIPKRIFNSNDEIDNCWKYFLDCLNNAQNGLTGVRKSDLRIQQ